MNDNYCLIMAGGSGTRFWPGSRTAKPKQYLSLFGGVSLLQSTVSRFESFIPKKNILIVSNESQAGVLEEQTAGIPRRNLIYEPVGKNTLPCIALAAMLVEPDDPEGIMVVSPSDHLIRDEELFRKTVETAIELAKSRQAIVTVGITPSYPATGFGYVETDEEITGHHPIRQFKVKRFVEKPNLEKASEYISQGGFYWNSGMFIFRISVFLEAVRTFAPALHLSLKAIQAESGKPSFDEALDRIYRKVEAISVDYGIMEHAQNLCLVEGNFNWNDLGSWESVYLYSDKDENGNASLGNTLFIDTANSYVYSDEGVVAVVGLEDVAVVKHGNAILVCKRDQAESVKKVVEELKRQDRQDYL